MNKLLCCLLLCSSFSTALLAEESNSAGADAITPTQVKFETSLGNIVIQLNTEDAPQTVSNFLAYVGSGFYDGTIFHRVINGFMIQGGGFTRDMTKKPTQASIRNESDNGLTNRIGTIAMARTNAPHSATAQFFINVNDNSNLDYAPGRWGYAVFGQVSEGMDIIDQIKQVSTGSNNGFRDVPITPIVINKAVALP